MSERPEDDPLYSSQKVAAMFHVTTETIRTWIKKGYLEFEMVGSRYYIRRSEVIRFANQRHGSGG